MQESHCKPCEKQQLPATYLGEMCGLMKFVDIVKVV